MNSFFIPERIIDELLNSTCKLVELYLSFSLSKIKFHISVVFLSLMNIVFLFSRLILFGGGVSFSSGLYESRNYDKLEFQGPMGPLF